MRSTFTVLCIILLSACQLSDDGHITDIIHYEKDPSSQSIPLEPTQVNSQFNTSFISDGKYGFHFIYNDPDIDLYELNINFQATKLDDLTNKIIESKASWVLVSVGGTTGTYCTPNDYYESLIDDDRGTTDIDIPLMLYDRLHEHDIKLMIRFGIDGPSKTRPWGERMGWNYGTETSPDFIDGVPTDEYVENVAEVLKVWGARYKDKLAGWWFDHAYEEMGWTEDQFRTIATAARHGNGSRVISFNNGVGIYKYTPFDNFIPGEVNHINQYFPTDQFLSGAQWHTFFYMGTNWGSNERRYKNFDLINYMAQVLEKKGGVTINIGVNFGTNTTQHDQGIALATAFKSKMPISFDNYVFRNKQTEKVLKVHFSQNGASVVQGGLSDELNSTLIPVSLGEPGNVFRIKNAFSQKFLAPQNFSSNNNQPLKQYFWNANIPAMRWVIVPDDSDGWFRIKNDEN